MEGEEKGRDCAGGYSFGSILEREKRFREQLSAHAGQDEYREAWESFVSSGKIGDYLRYRSEQQRE